MRHKVLAGLDAAKHIPWRGKQLLQDSLSALCFFLAFGDYSKNGENGGVLFSKAKVTAVTPSHSFWLEQWPPNHQHLLFPVVLEAGWAHRKLSTELTSHVTQVAVHGTWVALIYLHSNSILKTIIILFFTWESEEQKVHLSRSHSHRSGARIPVKLCLWILLY